MGRKKNRFCKTYTKKLVKCMLIIGVIGGFIPYILSYIGCAYVCEELGQTWITSVVAISLGYMVRGYRDSKEEGRIDLEHRKIDNKLEVDGENI